MTPDEFKAARKRVGLTQSQLGALLDTNPATIRRWEMHPETASARPPNPVACQVLRWLLAGFRPPGYPQG